MNKLPDNRAIYQRLSEEKQLPVMMQAWWFEVLSREAGKSWNALIINDEGGKIIGAMPIHIVERRFFSAILLPPFMFYFGIYIDYQGITDADERKSYEDKILARLAEKLQSTGVDYFSTHADKYFENAKLLGNHGFTLIPRHTYVVNDITNVDALLPKYHHMKARAVRKAMKSGLRCVRNSISPEEYYDIYKSILAQKREKVSFTKNYFVGLATVAIEHGQGSIFVIHDVNNLVHSAFFCVWDSQCAYALAYWVRHEYRNSGASSLMFHEAMRSLSGVTKEFDFEGGNKANIAASYSKFATTETPYYRFTKTYSLRGKLIELALKFL